MSSAPDSVVSLSARRAYRPDYRGLACAQVRAGREKLGLSHDEFAGHLGALLGRKITAELAKRWEQGSVPPGDVLLAAGGQVPEQNLLEAVPPSFPAEALAGPWVTCYQFTHAGEAKFHADIANVTAGPGDRIRAVNYPPEPRSEGRGRSFRNVISGHLSGRHLIGEWMNISDTRYYGSLMLAVLPGETVMEGPYAGVKSDVEVSAALWRWVRLDPGPVPPPGFTLRDPRELFDLVTNHSQYGAPMRLADVREGS
jgi:hypothetical protein